MAYSWQESVKPAGTQDIQCDIEYLDKSYIHVYLDGAETTAFTWTSSTNIRLNSPLSAETVVLLIRKTAREYLYIEFASGAPFIEGNVDTQNTQFLHLAQELVEGRYIEGFFGDINMHRYRINNLGDPVDVRDAANKQYVDAGDARLDQRIDAERAAWVAAVNNEASIRKASDDALDVRTTNLEQTYFNANTNSFPWWTVTTSATNTVVPGMPFTKAKVRLNGVTQTAGYSYSIANGVITFAETIPAGTLVDVTIGIDTEADTSAASQILAALGASDGEKWIGNSKTVVGLRNIEPSVDGQRITADMYREELAPINPSGGGVFIHKATSTAPDDGVFVLVTSGGKRWHKVLDRLQITPAEAGVYPSGGDDATALNTLFSTVAAQRSVLGRVRLDMMGWEFESSTGTTVVFDPTKIELVNFTITNKLYTSTTAFAIVRCSPTLRFQDGYSNVKGNVDNLIIKDSTRATSSPVTALHLTSPVNGAFSCVVFNNMVAAASYNGIAFGNHCYLVTWNHLQITAYNDLTDAITAGLETSITDAGENYVFNRPVFTGTRIFNWDNIEGEFNFYGASMDFVGGGINKRSGFVWGVYGGHLEFNNAYSAWFESSAVATVKFEPSRVLTSAGSATNLFYDSSATANSLKVHSRIGSWGGNTVGAIINTCLVVDTVSSIQGYQPPVRGRINKYLVDGTFTSSTIDDRWYADLNATRTSRLVSDTTTLSRGTVVNADGNTVGCLNITKQAAVGEGFPSGAHLCVQVPRGDTPAHISFRYKATQDVPVSVTVRLVSVLGFSQEGLPIYGSRVITSSAVNLTASTTEQVYRSSTGLNVSNSYSKYDFVQLSISTISAPANSGTVSIYDVLLNKIG